MNQNYTNKATQDYVDSLQAHIDATEKQLVSLRRASAQNGPHKRLAWTTSKIADLTSDEQSKIIRMTHKDR